MRRTVRLAAADESPRLLRNTYVRRHLVDGASDDQVSSTFGAYEPPDGHPLSTDPSRRRWLRYNVRSRSDRQSARLSCPFLPFLSGVTALSRSQPRQGART